MAYAETTPVRPAVRTMLCSAFTVAPSADGRDERLPGIQRRGVELVEFTDPLHDLARPARPGPPGAATCCSVSPVCTWTTASRFGTGAEVPTTPPNWATSPSHTVIAAASNASTTVVVGVIGRGRCDARDITTPVPR